MDKKKRLFVMTGVSGCGKSTFIQKQIAEHGGNWVSRDLIRLSMIEPGVDLFFHEDEVLEEFYNRINTLLESQKYHGDIYCDATHLTKKARREFFKHIHTELADKVIGIWFDVDVYTCLQQNDKRTGHAKVPENTIRSMRGRLAPPTIWEKPYNEIWRVKKNGEIEVSVDGKNLVNF